MSETFYRRHYEKSFIVSGLILLIKDNIKVNEQDVFSFLTTRIKNLLKCIKIQV